jgi:hypothetical protein
MIPYNSLHDPEVCGLGYHTDCPGCRGTADDAWRARQREADAAHLAALIRDHPAVRDALLAVLTEPIADIALAVAREVRP